MTVSARAGFLLTLTLLAGVQTAALAQWSLALEVGADRYWGGSVENTPEERSFRPYRPTTITVGVDRRTGRLAAALRLRYTEASLGLEGSDAVVAVKGAFTIVSVAPELSYRIATLGLENHLLLHAGPVAEFWSLVEADSRTRLGGQGAVSLRVPLGGRIALALAATAAVVPSPFRRDELDLSYDLRRLWRRGFAAGLHYRL